jgi:hypothetical protein
MLHQNWVAMLYVDATLQRHIQADIERSQDGHCRTNEHRRVRSIATSAGYQHPVVNVDHTADVPGSPPTSEF